MEDVIKMSAVGMMDPHPRVRYQALTSLGLLLNELAVSHYPSFNSFNFSLKPK